jgi:hypothetical protein
MRIDNLEDVKEFLESHENNIEKKKSLYMKIVANITLKKKYPDTNNDYNLVKLNQNKEYMKLRTIFSPGWKTTNELNQQQKSEEKRKSENLERTITGLPLRALEHLANFDTRNSSKFNEDFLTNLVMAKHVDELNNDNLYGPEHFLSDISFFDKNNSQEYPSMPGYGGIKRRTYKLKKKSKRTSKKSLKKKRTLKKKRALHKY